MVFSLALKAERVEQCLSDKTVQFDIRSNLTRNNIDHNIFQNMTEGKMVNFLTGALVTNTTSKS